MAFLWPWPKGSVSSQEFGTNPGGVNPAGGHTGMDVPLPVGTPLRAPFDAVVEFANWASYPSSPYLLTEGGGIVLVLNGGPGMPNIIMAHLSRTDLNPGDTVKRGQIVAYSGNTGTWTTGPHCHLEVMLDGFNMNSNTYGRSNPRVLDWIYWEDEVTVQPSASTVTTPILGYQRDSNTMIRQRSAPDHNSTMIKEWPADTRFDFGGYRTDGSEPYGDGNRTWFKGRYSDTWFHSSGFADQGTHDLPNLTPAPPVVVTPPPVVVTPKPTAPKYSFDLDFLTINGISVENIPAHWDNYGEEFPTEPSGVVHHWWNAPINRPSIDSVLNEFCYTSTSKSPHFVVTDTRIIQVVSLSDRAFHAGPTGNDKIGVEVDPYVLEKNADGTPTERALKIQANVRALNLAIRDKYKRKLNKHLHKEFMATSCSDLQLAWFDVPDFPPVVVTPPVVVVPPPTQVINESDVLLKFFKWLIDQFVNRPK